MNAQVEKVSVKTEATGGTALVWLRNDLRVQDNPALAYALRQHPSALCLYIDTTDWSHPPASAWWLRGALQDLSRQIDGRLLYLQGEERPVLEGVLREYDISAVYWNRRYEPGLRERDAVFKQDLRARGIKVASFPGNLLFEPWEVTKGDGSPYRVFTPFYKAARAMGFIDPHAGVSVSALDCLLEVPASSAERINGLSTLEWMQGFAEAWTPTRAAALQRLQDFADGALGRYDEQRNLPGIDGCSRLSPWLHFGQISPREITHRLKDLANAEPYVRELLWREFAHVILYHWPESVGEPMDRRFEFMPWRDDPQGLQRWQRGLTGVPLVDAGMRELWQTGFMHNRVRMVVASFLTKHLLIDWREGARWFEYTLVDADVANNRMGWQWCAGSGVDAAPYFRIFNPVSQGQRFDKDGEYVRHWVPELNELPSKWIHDPWEAPPEVLKQASLQLGVDYPRPLLDLKMGRERALAAWDALKSQP